jgi:hypothetical protein
MATHELLLAGTDPTAAAPQAASGNKLTVPVGQVPVTEQPAQVEQLSVMSSSTRYVACVKGVGQVGLPLLMMHDENPAGAVPLQTASLLAAGTSQ